MKLLWLFTIQVLGSINFHDRYLMDDPICPDVKTCAGIVGNGGLKCKGKTLQAPKGRIRVQARNKIYDSMFNCRWEIKAPEGKQIRIRITQGDKRFGVEYHPTCGFDRMHVQSINGDRYGRLCSEKKNAGATYNGLSAQMTFNGTKIQSKNFQDWITLPTNHLVVAYDSDRLSQTGRGFRMVYETTGEYIVPNEVREEILNLKDDEMLLLNQTFDVDSKYYTKLQMRIQDHYDHIFEKWHACGGASLDPTLKKPNVERTLGIVDMTPQINAIYYRYHEFIDAQLEKIGTCKPSHVRKISKKKNALEAIFIRSCQRIGKCL